MWNKRLYFSIIMLLGFVFSMAQNANREIINPPKKQDKPASNQIQYSDKSIKAFFIDEDFEGGSLPTGWTTQDGGSSWVISSNNSGDVWTIPNHTIYASILDVQSGYDDRANPDTYIATSSIDFSGTTNAKLSFDYLFDDQYGGHWRTKVSTDGGTTWSTMDYMEGSFTEWQSKLLDISTYVGNEPDVKIAFHFSDTANTSSASGASTGFAIDNVQIFESTSHDMGVESIDPSFAIEGNSVTPSVTLYNYGTETESVWSITLTDGDTYNETISDEAAIAPETEYTATFPQWSPLEGQYILEATLTLVDDANPDNDTLRSELNVVLPFSENALVGNGFTEEYFDFNPTTSSTTLIGSIPGSPIPTAEEFAANNQIFRVDNNRNLYTVNYTNGSTAYLTTLSGLSGSTPVGLAYNWNEETMYIATTDGSSTTYLHTLNLSTFNVTVIGSDSYLMSGMDFDESGNLYATTLSDSLVKVNTTDGSITAIGHIGHEFYQYHDLSFDRKNNKMLTIDVTPTGTFYGFYDLETGKFKKIAELPGTWNNVTFTHYYIPYTVTFNVTDGADPLQNATVNINGQTLTTNSSGETSINLTNDTYDYTVDLAGYDQATGTITVEGSAVTENVVLNETTYTATFTVNDATTNPLQGATISITGESDLTTDASGIATIDLPNDTYDYTVTLAGYDDFTGSFTISNAAETIEVTMVETTYTATFTVNDAAANPLQGATISITGESDLTTDASGIATIDLPNDTYDYTVTLAGYDDYTGSFTISDAAEAIDVTMVETTYTATFTVSDATANPLQGATISITGESDLTTDASGIATIDLPNDTYDYTVTLVGYDDFTGSFTISDAAEAIEVTMEETTYTATFTVTDGTDPLQGASISITGQNDLTTDATGVASIELVNGDYDYTVSYDGYYDSIGVFTIADANVDIDIVLDEVGINDPGAIGINIYPNPTQGLLYFKSDKTYKVTVLNTIGKPVLTKHITGNGTVNLSNQSPGIYILRIIQNNNNVTKTIILQ